MRPRRASSGPNAATSILKNVSAQVGQGRADLLLELMGHQGLGWDGEGFSRDERDAVRDWLAGKAATIFAGSFEIQSNIIAKRIPGLPDPT